MLLLSKAVVFTGVILFSQAESLRSFEEYAREFLNQGSIPETPMESEADTSRPNGSKTKKLCLSRINSSLLSVLFTKRFGINLNLNGLSKAGPYRLKGGFAFGPQWGFDSKFRGPWFIRDC